MEQEQAIRWWRYLQVHEWSPEWPIWTVDGLLRELADDEQKGFVPPEFAKELRAELMAQKLAGR